MPRRARVLVVLLAAGALAGCLSIPAASVPEVVLDARNWRENPNGTRSESAWGGLARTEVRVYEHPRGSDGFAGSLSIVTLRAFLEPSEERLREEAQTRVRAQAEARGIEISDEGAAEGARRNADERGTLWFTYRGVAVSSEALFSRNAEIRVVGEVWSCREARTAVVAVGLAQVNDERSIGGVGLPQRDTRTWAALVADPGGGIEGYSGRGLLHETLCG